MHEGGGRASWLNVPSPRPPHASLLCRARDSFWLASSSWSLAGRCQVGRVAGACWVTGPAGGEEGAGVGEGRRGRQTVQCTRRLQPAYPPWGPALACMPCPTPPCAGFLLELYGFWRLFSAFFPTVLSFLRRMPFLRSMLDLPAFKAVSRFGGGECWVPCTHACLLGEGENGWVPCRRRACAGVPPLGHVVAAA